MNGTRQREVGEYLRRLQRAMGDLPAQRRDEILAEIEEHIASGLAELSAPTETDVRNVLERLGDPADIAAEARERFGIRPAKRTWTDSAAIILLLIGGFTIIGWFVGVVFLWISDTWNARDKIIGTLVVPGGLAGALGVGLVSSGVQGGSCGPVEVTVAPAPCATAASSVGNVVGLILAVLLLSAPIVTAVYLSLRLHRVRASNSDESAAGARDER